MAACANTLVIAVLCSAAVCAAQEPADVDEEIIVRGKSYGDFRLEIERARDVFLARFNEINSDDRFDIHCREEVRIGSKLRDRVCASNSWREQDANFAYDFVRELLGETGANPQRHRGEQLRMQRLLEEEMQRLATEDAELREAFLHMGRAMQALSAVTGARPAWTLFREVGADAGGLPFGAQQVFEVQVGFDPWTHSLTNRTFTIGEVSGSIRGLDLECAENAMRLKYQSDVEWTVPTGWSACTLRVRAKRGATFRLYEFQ